MQNFLIINASPRKSGTSAMVAGECYHFLRDQNKIVRQAWLYDYSDRMEELLSAVKDADTIIISGPCYINTYPADVTNLLEQIESHPETLHGQKLYGMIQGGMPYAHTHKSGLNMLEVFANQTGMQYCGGFLFGLGAMLDGHSLDALPNGKKVKKQFQIFLEHINKSEISQDAIYEKAMMRVPKLFAKILVKFMNKHIDQLYAKDGLDAYAPSPYSSDKLN